MMSLVVSYPSSTSYCASFDSSHSGVNGYFAMTIDESTGLSYYDFKVDLVSYDYFATLCPSIGNGLKYHIHSYWTNTTASNTASCAASNTGGHFDPYFACGTSSQYQTSPILCPSLNRTASLGFTYPCTASNFAAGNLQCEVGDLSGKFGAVRNTTTATLFESSSLSSPVLSDPLGPSITTYGYGQPQTTTAYTNMWNSIVFHCPDPPTNTRLFCAQLSTSLDSCVAQGATFSPSSTSADTSKTYSAKTFNLSVAAGVIIAFVFGALASYMFTTYKAKQSKGLLDKGGVNDPLIQNY